MKKAGQQTRFRDDLRRLLLFYSLLPVLSAALLLIVFLGVYSAPECGPRHGGQPAACLGRLWPGMAKPAK